MMNEEEDFRIRLVGSVFVAAEIRKSMYLAQSGKKLKI